MIQIRLHGRGGQGVVSAAQMIAIAAFQEDLFSRSFATYGVERRGSPVTSFAMIGPKEEITRSKVYTPDCVIVLDPYLPKVMNVTEGLKKEGMLIQNIPKTISASEILAPRSEELKLASIDATSIAMEILERPIPNTVMLGAFARATNMVKLESMLKAIGKRFRGEQQDKNKNAVQAGYERVKINF
ncbi:MAG: pyruvate ferredoxin oxidoreductase [Nitrososphaeria archaeon]|nr:pyruvate ferredoxin oxidoreductase [Nitrososphaeria archaeon]